MDSCIIEGDLTNAENDTEVSIFRKEGRVFRMVCNAQIMNGHFQLAVMPLSQQQELVLNSTYQNYNSSKEFWIAPGVCTTVIGKGNDAIDWTVENSTFDQKELNAIETFFDDRMPQVKQLQKKLDWFQSVMRDSLATDEKKRELVDSIVSTTKQREAIIFSKANEIMDFLMERPYSVGYMSNLELLADLVCDIDKSDDKLLVNKARKLYDRIPDEYIQEPTPLYVKTLLYPDCVNKGDKLVDFTFTDHNGKAHHLNEFAGKYVLLEFTGWGCPPCERAKPFLNDLYGKYSDKLEIISVSVDHLKTWKEHKDDQVIWHDWNDGKSGTEIKNKYGVKSIPHFFSISPEGVVFDIQIGYSDQIKQQIISNFPFILQ